MFDRIVIRLVWLGLAAALALSAHPAIAQETLRGVALVIGNGEYEHLAPLANPNDDARAVEDLLSDLGFETELSSDRDARRLARDLEDFVEDAEGADVAVVYYAGHGIEAGGENWLVPVDADIAALDEAAEKLVPLSRIVAELRASVGVTIVLLDACRDNPFPAGATLKLLSGEAAPVSAGGLAVGDTRGASGLSAPAAPADTSLGIVVGFAAEPGKVALDGAPGQHSPYAAALIKHFTALAGAEFGQVMRLVGEEVYLKTSGRQRPWVNESLRRLLYFGEAPDAPQGPEGEILTERRQLLLTIAALPDFRRVQVERAAAGAGVPMDALYGLLGALGQDVPEDAAELEKLLGQQALRLREMMAERAALKSTDPEILRLAALAETAVSEGALATAIRLHEQAKARVQELAAAVDRTEADIRDRRIEFAEVFGKSAETYELSFRYRDAADDWKKAFDQVERWDDGQAWYYKVKEAGALAALGETSGENAVLAQAAAAYELGLRFLDAGSDRRRWAATQNNMAAALAVLGEREANRASLDRAAAAYEAALSYYAREAMPDDWASTTGNLATVWWRLGQRENSNAMLERAADAFRDVLAVQAARTRPLEWAATQLNLGVVLSELGDRARDRTVLEQALAAHREALTVYRRDSAPIDWAQTHVNIGATLIKLAALDRNPAMLDEAAAALEAAAQEITRERAAGQWATIQSNLSTVWTGIGDMRDDVPAYDRARAAAEAALSVHTRQRAPLNWANAQFNFANALYRKGEATDDAGLMRQAVAAYELAAEEYPRDLVPLEWASARQNLAAVWDDIADVEPGTEAFETSAANSRAALEVYTASENPLRHGESQYILGGTLASWAERTGDASLYREAIDAYERSAVVRTRELDPAGWAKAQYRRAHALSSLAQLTQDDALIDPSIGLYREALAFEVGRADPDPGQLAAVRWGLGFVLARRGESRRSGDDYLEAVGLLDAALAATDRAVQPENWARIAGDLAMARFVLAEAGAGDEFWQGAFAGFRDAARVFAELGDRRGRSFMLANLANGLLTRGGAIGDLGDLAEARDVYLETLTLIDRDGAPEDWARMQSNYATALWNIGHFGNDDAALRAAVDAFRLVQQVRPRDIDPERWARSQDSLSRVLALVAERQPTAAAYDAVATAYGDLSDFYGRDRVTARWANARNELGYQLTLAGRALADPARFERAVTILREAVAVQLEIGARPDLAYTQDSLCDVLTDLGAIRRDAAMADEAIAACTDALAGFEAASLADLVALSRTNLAEAQALADSLR